MHLTLPFTELNTIVQQKTNQPVEFGFVSDDTISIAYKMNLLLKTVNINATVQVLSVDWTHVEAKIDMGSAGNLLLQGGLGVFGSMLPEGLVESFTDGIAEINLARIPKLEKTLAMFDVKGVAVAPELLNLEVVIK